jgi:hypothetical protein
VLSHPDATWFAVCGSVVMFLFHGRSGHGIVNSLAVAAGVLAFTGPWWGTVVYRHGLAPLMSASRTSGSALSYLPWVRLLLFRLTPEVLMDVATVLGLLGVFVCVARRKLHLPFWLAVTLVMDPRSASRYVTVPLAMLAEIAVCQVILPGMNRLSKDGHGESAGRCENKEKTSSWLTGQLESGLSRAVLAVIFAHLLVSAMVSRADERSPLRVLPEADRQAMEWVALNTSPESKFVVVTPDRSWAEDSTSEWFPVLASRTSLATVQGTEWLPGGKFHRQWERFDGLQACATEGVDCLDSWAENHGAQFTHVYVSKSRVDSAVSPQISRDCCGSLRGSLTGSGRYVLTYDGPGAAVFARWPEARVQGQSSPAE